MNSKLRISEIKLLGVGYIFLYILLPFIAVASSQSCLSEAKWLIELTIKENIYKAVKRSKSRPFSFRPDTMIFNGRALKVKQLHTRGKTTLKFWRKSYTVSLDEKMRFDGKGGEIEMDHFYLISMSLDKNYFHNRLAFECLQKIDLFPLFYHYVEVKINGKSEGLYLLVQRPSDYVLEDLGSRAILRRGSSEYIDKEKYAKTSQDAIRKDCQRIFKEIRNAGNRKGEDLYRYLNERIDMTSYFNWLAFNYLVHNGDYTDEVFYYLSPDMSNLRFDIIPWDFDDIFVSGPHEGLELRNQRLGDQLIFSSEDKLDRTIARDPYLYHKYLDQFLEVMERLNTEFIRGVFNQIGEELAPYFQSDSIIEASQYDLRPIESWNALQENLELIYGYLNRRVHNLRQIAESQ